jgi:hypothetical protein
MVMGGRVPRLRYWLRAQRQTLPLHTFDVSLRRPSTEFANKLLPALVGFIPSVRLYSAIDLMKRAVSASATLYSRAESVPLSLRRASSVVGGSDEFDTRLVGWSIEVIIWWYPAAMLQSAYKSTDWTSVREGGFVEPRCGTREPNPLPLALRGLVSQCRCMVVGGGSYGQGPCES